MPGKLVCCCRPFTSAPLVNLSLEFQKDIPTLHTARPLYDKRRKQRKKGIVRGGERGSEALRKRCESNGVCLNIGGEVNVCKKKQGESIDSQETQDRKRTLEKRRPNEPFSLRSDIAAADAADAVAFKVVGEREEGEVGGQYGEGDAARAGGEREGKDRVGGARESEACTGDGGEDGVSYRLELLASLANLT
jgi:hypothetical protein